MNNYTIVEVKTTKDAKNFRAVANQIYQGDTAWVKPFDSDIESVFDPARNERFNGGQAVRWILYQQGQAVGRIAAFFNGEDASKESQPTGGCGFFECINSIEAAHYLFDTAREWLGQRGMQAMDGSVNFGDRMMWWGVMVKGFVEPIYGMNYNKPYYKELFEEYGFEVYFNQHTYLRRLEESIHMEPALYAKAERLFADPDYLFTTFDKGDMPKMARDFVEVYNTGWAKFEGVKPLNFEHAMAMFSKMKLLIDPHVIHMAYYKGQAIGFFVMVPDLNRILRYLDGKLGWWQKLRLIYMLRVSCKIDRVAGLIFGVHGDFQGKGVEAGMIRSFEIYIDGQRESGHQQYKSLIMGWIGDFNPVMMRMCEGYVKAEKYIQHSTYRYLFDRGATFERCPRLGRKK
ncbi:MAG: hypothetical protein RR286_05020 [Mucinivorans sp.]